MEGSKDGDTIRNQVKEDDPNHSKDQSQSE